MDAFNAAWRTRIDELSKSPDAHLAANKRVALEFLFGLVLASEGKEDIEDVTNRYLDVGYIQHDPNILTGRDGFTRWFRAGGQTPNTPTAPKVDLRQVDLPTMVAAVAEGDYVTTLSQHLFPDPTSPGQRYMWFHIGFFRIQNGKIIEHWDEGMKGAYWCRLGLCDPK
jgi:predicted SnoaL-like aldol condensation-catalyzing enzyme